MAAVLKIVKSPYFSENCRILMKIGAQKRIPTNNMTVVSQKFKILKF